MNILEMYKRLSNEDKTNLTIYSIYDGIYDGANENDFEISDEVAIDLQEMAHNLFNEEENLTSPNKIGRFLSECYIRDNDFIRKYNEEEFMYDDLLQAIVDDNLEFYDLEEMER